MLKILAELLAISRHRPKDNVTAHHDKTKKKG
jgi:hypothetical protein